MGIVIVVAEAFPFETAGDVAAVLMNDRLDDVAGMVAVDLDDVFAEIGFNGLNALCDKVVIEVDLLRDHALGFDDLFCTSFFQDIRDGAAGVIGSHRIVNMGPVAIQAGFSLFEVGIHILNGMLADRARKTAKRIGISEVLGKGSVAFFGSRCAIVMDGLLNRAIQSAGVAVNFLFRHGFVGRLEGFERSEEFLRVCLRVRQDHPDA